MSEQVLSSASPEVAADWSLATRGVAVLVSPVFAYLAVLCFHVVDRTRSETVGTFAMMGVGTAAVISFLLLDGAILDFALSRFISRRLAELSAD